MAKPWTLNPNGFNTDPRLTASTQTSRPSTDFHTDAKTLGAPLQSLYLPIGVVFVDAIKQHLAFGEAGHPGLEERAHHKVNKAGL